MPPARSQAPRAETREELVQKSSRDLSGLVEQVRSVLPQFSPDLVCEMLILKDEDVAATIELLLNSNFETKTSKKKKKKQESAAVVEESPVEVTPEEVPEEVVAEPQEPKDDRPPTAAEKQALKVKKKVREIERIEERLARNEKVDPLQLPKLERKREFEDELRQLQLVIDEEERIREQEKEQARIEAELEAQRLQQEAEARAAAEADARRQQAAAEAAAHRAMERVRAQEFFLQQQQQRELEEESRRKQQVLQPPQPAHELLQALRLPLEQRQSEVVPQAPGLPIQDKGMDILSMLHKPAQASGSMEETRRLAQQMSEDSGAKLQVGPMQGQPPSQPPTQPPHRPPQQPPQQQYHQGMPPRPAPSSAAPPLWQQQQPLMSKGWQIDKGGWGHEASQEWPPQLRQPEEVSSFMNEYSTPLDVSSIPLEKRREAERIAKEIEGPPGVPQQKGGYPRDPRPAKGGGGGGGGGSRKGGGGGASAGYGGGYGGGGRKGDRKGGGSYGGGDGGKNDSKGKGKGRGRRDDGAGAVGRADPWGRKGGVDALGL